MKSVRQFIIILALLILPMAAIAQTTIASCEYWIDGQFDKRRSVAFSDSLETLLDLSAYSYGVHTLGLRVSDSKGRWSSPIVKFFLRRTVDAHDSQMTSYEYWIDDYSNRVAGNFDGETLDLDIDVSAFSKGVHTFSMRTKDSDGCWSSVVTKFFINTFDKLDGNTMKGYRYWIDGNFESAVAGKCADGIADLELDLSTLSKGVHSISIQAEDSRGVFGSPVCKFFVVPEPALAGNTIAAYEYWFNHGSRKRVEVEPVTLFTMSDVWIDIVDVVPNSVPKDYRFDAVQGTVWCDDNVTFGLQAFDALGKGTMAVLSDTFAMSVPVKIQYSTLINSITEQFDAPQKGCIDGFIAYSSDGDSLEWYAKGGCSVDFYSESGARLDAVKTTQGDTLDVYRTVAQGKLTYMLAYSNKELSGKQEVKFINVSSTGIYNPAISGTKVYTENGTLVIDSNVCQSIAVYNASGQQITDAEVQEGKNIFNVAPGIYTVKTKSKSYKIFVR